MLNVTKQTRRIVLMACIGSLFVPHKSHAVDDGWAAGLFLGGLAAAAVGAVCYVFSESDETVTSNAEISMADVARRYDGSIDNFCSYHHLTSCPTNPQRLIDSADEINELFTTAQRIIASGSTMKSYLSHLNNAINELKIYRSKVESRKRSLEGKRYLTAEEARLLQRMQRVYAEMQDMLPYLDLYHTFFSAHRVYFDLYEYEVELYSIYQQEFHYGHTYQYDPLALGQALRQCVGARFHASAYPYIAYKYELDMHIKALQSYMRGTQRYAVRYAAAAILEQYLVRVRGIILADPMYTREKEARRAERHYQQQQQLMQQQLAAQQQMLAAQQAQTRALEEQNRIDRQKKHGGKADVSQPHTHVTVTHTFGL